jgi:hypothetical protein
MTRCVILLVAALAVGAGAFSLSADQAPRFAVRYEFGKVHLQTNVTYVSAPDTLYTYVFGFSRWTQASSLFDPANCTNRLAVQFSANNPVLWSSLWARLEGALNSTSISGAYLAWPTPSLPWVVSVGGPATVVYDGDFAIDALLACAAGAITETVTGAEFVYTGTFYVHWVQPIMAYLPGLPYSALYSSVGYPFPFAIAVPRNVSALDGSALLPSFVSFYLLELDWEPLAGGASYRLRLLLLTRTPPSTAASGALLNYNAVVPVSQTLAAALPNGLELTLDSNGTQSTCSIDAQSMCAQTWAYFSTEVPAGDSALQYNDSYEFGAILESCPLGGGACVPYSPPLATGAVLSADLFLAGVQRVGVVAPFSSNISFFADGSFAASRPSADYWPGQTLWFAHRAFTAPIAADFYALRIENVYICAPVPGGRAPFLGFDPALQIWRYGCSRPETIAGAVNIAADAITAVALNGSSPAGALDFGTYTPSSMPRSECGASFIAPSAGAFYLHVDSLLFPGSRPGGQSASFRPSTADPAPPTDSAAGIPAGALAAFSVQATQPVPTQPSPAPAATPSLWTPAAIAGTVLGSSAGVALLAMFARWMCTSGGCTRVPRTASAAYSDVATAPPPTPV